LLTYELRQTPDAINRVGNTVLCEELDSDARFWPVDGRSEWVPHDSLPDEMH
jgi:hypothetical protein